MSHLTDDELLAAARGLPARRPDELTQRRRRARLDDAIAAEAQQRRRRLTPVAAALALFLLAGSASAAIALAVVAARADRDDVVSTTSDGVMGVGPVAAPLPDAELPGPVAAQVDVEAEGPVVGDTDVGSATTGASAPVGDQVAAAVDEHHPVVRQRRVDVLDRLLSDVQRDDGRAARSAWMRHAGTDFAKADARLVQVIDGAKDEVRQARLRRTRCETWLRHRRSVEAVDVCRGFCQHHPDDPAARPLAFGAGGVAEELGALDDAIDLYTRSIILSPLQGQSSADAIKARARVHARAGHDDDAAADLRLFLRLRPAAAFDDDVRALADRLGL